MAQRTPATVLLRLVALASVLCCVHAFCADEITLPGSGTVVLGQDDALELILKPNLKTDGAQGVLPQLRAWLIEPGQPAPKTDAPESARALIWPSPTRANEFIAHLRGLTSLKKDDEQAYDILLRWSFPGGNEAGETRLSKAVSFRTGLPSVVLLLDGSGSMTTSDPEKSRIEAARRFIATGKTSGGIGSIGIIQFASQVHELLPLTPISDDDKFQRALKAITADGFTDIDGSIRKAVEMLHGPGKGSGTGAIVLLTDGVQEPGIYGDAHRLARAAGIPIHTVALGPDADRDLLQRIADDTGGTFSAAASGGELIRIYGAIAAGIAGGRTIFSGPFPAAAPRALVFPTDSTCRTLVASVSSESSGTLTVKSPKGETETTSAAEHPVFHKISPPPGAWTAQWPAGASARLEASAHTSLYPLFFRAATDATGTVEIDPDDPRIGLSLTDGATPLAGATVDVSLEIADRSERLAAILFDDGTHEDGTAGDGIYAGFVAKLAGLDLPVGTTGVITATVSGKRAVGEDFRREVRAHWTLVRGSARGLVVPHALDLGTHFAGERVSGELLVRVRGAGGNYRFTSKTAANMTDLSKQLVLLDDRHALPSREAATLPLQLTLPDELGPGSYGGLIELELDGEKQAPKVTASVPWHVRVKLPELALNRFALLDLGSVAPGAQIQASLPLATRGGRTRLAGVELNDCAYWTSLLRLPRGHAAPLSVPRSELLKLTAAPEPFVLDEHRQAANFTFTVSPECRAGTLEREVVLRGSGRELGRVLVRVDVQPQWFELGGDLNFGQLEPGDAAAQTLSWKLGGGDAQSVRVNSAASNVIVDASKPNDARVALKLPADAPAGSTSGTITLHGNAADAAVRWTANVVQPELNLSATALDFGSIFPGQTRKLAFRATFKGVRPTSLIAAIEAPPTKPLVRTIHLAEDALKILTRATTLQPGGDAEVALELRVPDSAQDGIYKTSVKVVSRLGAVEIPVAFQVVYPIPLPPFHVTPIEVVLNVYDGQPDKPVTVTVFSQSDEPLPIRAHCEPTAGMAHISAELIRDAEAAPEKSFVLPGRGEAKFHIRALTDSEDGDQTLIVVESGSERQTIHATVVHSHRISATPTPHTEGFDWWTLLIIIPLMICAVFVRKLVKRRWVRVAAYSGLLHFGLFFFIVIPQSRKDDSFGSVEASQGMDIDLTKLDDGGGATEADGGAAGAVNDTPAAAGPRGGDGLAALGGGKENANGALAGLKDGGNGPGGPAAAAAIQKAGAGDAAPAGGGPAFERGPSTGGPDEALAMNDDPGGVAPLVPAAKPEPAGAPAAAHVPLTTSKIELPAGSNGPGTKQASSAAAAKTEAGGGNPDEKVVLVGAPGAARGDGQPLAMDDIPLIADTVGAPSPDAPKLETRGPAKSTLGEPSAPATVTSIAATSNPGASALGPEIKNSAPATRYISGTSGAVVPENGKAWGDSGAERGSAVAGTESNRKTGLLVGRGDDDALDAGPVLGEGLASSGNSGKTTTSSGAGGSKDGASISGAGANGLGGEGTLPRGEGTLPRGGHGLTTATGTGRGLGSGEGLGGSGNGTGDGIGRGAGPGNHGFGGPGGLGNGYGGKGDGSGIAGRAIGSGRGGSGTGTGGAGFGNGHGIGDAPLDLGGNGSGTGGNGNGNGSGTGTAAAGNGAGTGAGSGNGTGIASGNGDGGPGSPRGLPGGIGTLGGRGTGGNDIGIASGGSGHGLGMGSQTGGVASGLGNGLPGSNGESLTSRSIGNGRGTGSGSGRPGPGDAPLDADPLGAGSGAGSVAQAHGNGTGIGNGKGIGDEGPPGPRGNGPLGVSGLTNGKGTGGGGTELAGLGLGSGGLGGHGPAGSGTSGTGSGHGASGFGSGSGGKASVQAAIDGLTLDRGGKNSSAALAHSGAESHDRPHWGPPGGTVLRVNLGLAQHAADWNSSPTALFNLATAFRERCGLPDVEAEVRTVKLDDPKAMASCRFLLFTANYAIPFSDAELLAMRAYVENGGTLWFNDSGASGDERFDLALRKDMVRLFPGQKLEKLEMTHPLFHSAYDLTHGYKGYRVPPGDKYRQEFMEGITLAGRDGKPRAALIYTRNDYADGLEIDPRNIAGRPSLTDLTADEMLEGSLRFGINLLAYSLGSDAPQMPPPPESAAQFEKIYRYNGPPLKIVDAFSAAVGDDGNPVWAIQEWGNPAKFELVDGPSGATGLKAIKIAFQSGDKMKAAAGRNVELNLAAANSIVVDIHSSLNHGFNVALLFSTKPEWLGYESRPIFIRPGWNRNVRFPLNLDDFKTAKNDWKVYDQPFTPRASIGHIDFLLYNLNENGEVKIESFRVESSN